MNFGQGSSQRTCRKHKGNKYMCVCSFPQCYSQRLCCLKCMISQHTDHSHYLVLLDELQDSNIEELQVPTNWTNILGNLKDDLGDIIRICKQNIQSVSNFQKNIDSEISKIDVLFDTILKEFQEKLNQTREHIKFLTRKKTQETSHKLNDLIKTLQRVLSPTELLDLINNFVNSDEEGDYTLDEEFDRQLNSFFQTPRIKEEEHEQIYRKFNFLTKNKNNEALVPKSTINLEQINEIREQILNTIEDQSKFAQIFFPENKLYDYENLEKIRVYTCAYDEMTKMQGAIAQIQPVDDNNFLVSRDNHMIEIWDVVTHQCKKQCYIKDFKGHPIPIKTTNGITLLYLSNMNSFNLLDMRRNQILKVFPLKSDQQVKMARVVSNRDIGKNIKGKIIIVILFENGEIITVDLTRGSIQEIKGKLVAKNLLIETLDEQRYYTTPDKSVVQSNLLLSCTQEFISVWYPLTGKCVRNIKIGNKITEVIKQIKGFEITNYEKNQSQYQDFIVNCPSKMAVAVLTNRYLRVYNWFKAQCLREIQIDECDKFAILPSFIRNDLKNVFLLYNISENKPAEYVTCDWSTSEPEYWNSGSLTNYTQVIALNNYKVMELGKIKSNDQQKKGQISARLKSLT